MFKYSKTTTQAYEIIKREILDVKFKAGVKLDETEICSELGISRTPIREALRRLEEEGFIERTSQIGCTVKLFSLKEVKELYEVRKVLELAASKLVLEGLNPENFKKFDTIFKTDRNMVKSFRDVKNYITREGLIFHQLISDLCGNEVLSKILNNVLEKLSLIHRRVLEDERTILSVKEHNDILMSLREKNGVKLEAGLINHIDSVKKYVIDMLLREEKYFV